MIVTQCTALILISIATVLYSLAFDTRVLRNPPPPSTLRRPVRVVVVGGGWAGFSVADALSTATFLDDNKQRSTTTSAAAVTVPAIQVELLDASPRGPGGLAGGWRTPKLGMPVESGIHGFWREYRNTLAVMERIGLKLDHTLTNYTPSVLVSQSGRVALAPVIGDTAAANVDFHPTEKQNVWPDFSIDWNNPSALVKTVASLLPPPLDLALLSEFSADSGISAADRLSALGLLAAWADFRPEDSSSWQKYDDISAESLFCATAGVSSTLYRELVSPLLHVLPMTPGYDCSAAAALSCFHVFALQSRGAFDVRWCRGSIRELIFNPWAKAMQSRRNAVNIRGSAKVTSIVDNPPGSDSKFSVAVNNNETIECDVVVFALGATTLKRLRPSFAPLSKIPVTYKWDQLRGVTCVAVRLFLRPQEVGGGLPASIQRAMMDSPVFVCGSNVGGIPALAETGFCIYDLQRLQDEFSNFNPIRECVALEVDFFRADVIANMADDMEVAKLTLKAVAAALNVGPLDPNLLLDVSVVRANEAVSHFCVSSAACSPKVRLGTGLYICGDWVDRSGHASWSTEKSVVTGRQAAAALAQDFSLHCDAQVIPAPRDTQQLATLRQLMSLIRLATAPLSGGSRSSKRALNNQPSPRQPF